MFTKNNNIEIKCGTDEKNNFYSRCINCSLKMFEIIDNEN